MPIFKYRGYGDEGKEATGTIEAEGMRDAVLKVKDLGLYPRHVEPYARKRRRFLASGEQGRLPAFARQLSVMLRSRVPLADALRALAEESPPGWREVVVGIRDRVVSGSSLSRALESAGDGLFPEFMTSMVAAGEESGTLDEALSRIAAYLESMDEARAKLRTAMIYPLFMVSVGTVVLGFLFVFVVPKIVRIFEDASAALPLATRVLIATSNVLVNYWWLVGLGAVAAWAGARAWYRKNKGTAHRALFVALKGLYLSRFSRALGFLLRGGMPLIRAIELSGRTSGNMHLESVARASASSVSEGVSLSGSLSGLPPVLLQLISTGEKSGRLSDVLEEAADAYEAEFDRRVQKALALLEPSLILAMGLVVGFIVFAVLLPMFQLNQLIR